MGESNIAVSAYTVLLSPINILIYGFHQNYARDLECLSNAFMNNPVFLPQAQTWAPQLLVLHCSTEPWNG